MSYFAERLPEELVQSLSNVMMPVLIPRIISTWLDSAVPSSLDEMDNFQGIVEAVQHFVGALRASNYTGFDELQEWVDNLPRVWLSKCRETALDSVRSRLAEGLGDSKVVERVETHTVSRSEGKELAANGVAPDDAWDSAWSDDEAPKPDAGDQPKPEITDEDDGADNWGWGDDGGAADAETEDAKPPLPAESTPAPGEDDAMDAWGWGDDDTTDTTAVQAAPEAETSTKTVNDSQTRELTLKETYNISSMPEPVLALISAVLEDGASLVGSVYTANALVCRRADPSIGVAGALSHQPLPVYSRCLLSSSHCSVPSRRITTH